MFFLKYNMNKQPNQLNQHMVWIISYWMYLGKPKKFNIVELGPGNGKLAQNLLKT